MLTDPLSGNNPDRYPKDRLVNLITGLELLSIGTSFHDFNKYGSNISGEETASMEKGYTLDLLFGDIFYSRAVIYLLKFRDHMVFDSILEALKRLHESRLKLHLIIQDLLETKGDPSAIGKDRKLLIDANRLLYISFMVGQGLYGIFNPIKRDHLARIIEHILVYKTYGELMEYARSLPGIALASPISTYLKKNMLDASSQTREILQKTGDNVMQDSLNLILKAFPKTGSQPAR